MSDRKTIYFDHAATSWPKPPCVADSMCRCMEQAGANPGRSGHAMSVDAARIIFEARETIADFFGLSDSSHVAFTLNATHALNIAILGLIQEGSHIITTSMEHNSVMRPLSWAQDHCGVQISCVPADGDGQLDLDEFEQLFRDDTSLVVAVHGSNVDGAINPVSQMGQLCRDRDVPFLVDACQTAGCVPIAMEEDCIDLLAFTGHKSMLGPQGVGGLCANVFPRPLYHGGSGSRSEHLWHPEFMPDRLEAGTPNTVAIAGLLAGVDWINDTGINDIWRRKEQLTRRLQEGLSQIPGIDVYCASDQLAVVSFVPEDFDPGTLCRVLDTDYGIATRAGLHCAPSAHRTLGTFPRGTVRMSLGYSNTFEEIDTVVNAVQTIISS